MREFYHLARRYCASIKAMQDPMNLDRIKELDKERQDAHYALCFAAGLSRDDTRRITDNMPELPVDALTEWLLDELDKETEAAWWRMTTKMYHDSWQYTDRNFDKESEQYRKANWARDSYEETLKDVRDGKASKEAAFGRWKDFLRIVAGVRNAFVRTSNMRRFVEWIHKEPEHTLANRYYMNYMAVFFGIERKTLEDIVKGLKPGWLDFQLEKAIAGAASESLGVKVEIL